MDRSYSEKEIKRILCRDIGTSAQTEKKIQEAYDIIRADASRRFGQTDAQQSGRFEGVQADARQGGWSEGVQVNVRQGGWSVDVQADARQGRWSEGVQGRRSEGMHTDAQRSGTGGRTEGRRSARRRILSAAAIAAALAVCSVTALALSGVFRPEHVVETDGGLSYKLEINYELKPTVVDVTPSYVPEGYQTDNNIKWYGPGEGEGFTIVKANASYLNSQAGDLDIDEVESVEEMTVNGMRADVVTIPWDRERQNTAFDKRIYLFDETDGCVITLYGCSGMSMEEFKKVAEGLKIEPTGETVDYESPEVISERMSRETAELAAYEQQIREQRARGVPQEYIYGIGETFMEAYEENVQIAVIGARVVDSIADYPQEYFGDYERVAAQLNEDGTAKPYTRLTIGTDEENDGEEIARDENVQRRFLEVTLKAENIGGETAEYWAAAPTPAWLTPSEEGNCVYTDSCTEPLNRDTMTMQPDGMAIYFDKSPYAGETSATAAKHFYYADIAPGETLEYTLLFAVDADMLSDLYLEWSAGGGYYDDETGEFNNRYVRLAVAE